MPSIEERMAVAETKLREHDREISELRKVKHDYRGAIAGIGHLATTVEGMTAGFEKSARMVAVETVNAALAARDDDEHKRGGRLLQWAAICITAAGLLLNALLR